MSIDSTKEVTGETSAVWKNHVSVADTPEGFTVRTTYPTNPSGVEVMLERWVAGSEEPPHSHPGDDMTIVVKAGCRSSFTRNQLMASFLMVSKYILTKVIQGMLRLAEFTMPNTLKTVSWFTFTTKPLALPLKFNYQIFGIRVKTFRYLALALANFSLIPVIQESAPP